jgi:hypothetical protein
MKTFETKKVFLFYFVNMKTVHPKKCVGAG